MYNKKVLVIAGGYWQVPIISFLKGKSYEVTVVDPNSDAPGGILSDIHILEDVRNYSRILELVTGKDFDFIISDQSDITLETVSRISESLGKRGNSIESVNKFTNKYKSREFAAAIGIPVPVFRRVNKPSDLKEALREVGLPAIIKPVDAQSSRGIVNIDDTNIEQADVLVQESFNASFCKEIIVESFFVGTEFTVEGYCSNFEHKTLGISRKKHFKVGIASDLEYPAIAPEEILEKIENCNDKYVMASGLEFGITHAEYLINEETGDFILVEIACRGGGTLISSDIIRWVSGNDLYEFLYSDLTGNPIGLEKMSRLNRPALLHFFEFPSGKVVSVSGLETIRAMEGVYKINLDFKPGDMIKPAKDDRSRQGFVILFCHTKEHLESLLATVYNTLKVEIEK